jgi:tetratricopeptide (TPR) repeat protein
MAGGWSALPESNRHQSPRLLALAYYGLFLATEGHAGDVIEHSTEACQIDPLSPLIHGISAFTLFSLGRFDTSDRAARQALDLQPDYSLGLWIGGLALSGLGCNEGHESEFRRAAEEWLQGGQKGVLSLWLR